MKAKRVILVGFALIMFMSLCFCCGCGGGQNRTAEPPAASSVQTETQDTAPDVSSNMEQQLLDFLESDSDTSISGEVVIAFDYKKQTGSASNQFAVWIEDMDANLVKTLYATRYTVNGGYKDRPDSIAIWVEKSALASMTKSEADAITGATPPTGRLSYTWDLTGADGETVLPGQYQFFVEGTLRWKNYVLYSGVILLGNTPTTVQADTKFVYEASGRNAALTDKSPENAMIGPVTATFTTNNQELEVRD